MMKTKLKSQRIFVVLLLAIPFMGLSQDLITITGIVTGSDNTPLAGVGIVIKGTENGTQTDFDGFYSISDVPQNAILVLSYGGFKTFEESVENRKVINISIKETESILDEVLVNGGSVSSKNYWLGAKIGYNFIGDTDDNFFVGSASIAINLIEGLDREHTFGVLGNIGNFKFEKKDDSKEDIKKLTQSINGISVGLGYTHESDELPIFQENGSLLFRQFVQTGVRITSFDKIGVDEETATLAQSATTAGLEMEITGFKNKGALTISTGVSLYLFDKNIYQKIFEEEKSNLVTLDFTVILPISEKVGFFTNGTFAKDASAAFIMGIILNP